MDQQLPSKMRISLGEYEIVEVNQGKTVVLSIGGGVHIHVHIAGLTTTHKPGDRVPLLTELNLCHH